MTRTFPALVFVGVVALPASILTSEPSNAQEVTAFCGISGFWETAASADNRDCELGVLVRIDGDIQPGLGQRLEPLLASLSVPEPQIPGLKNTITVELRSNGGNVFAAMEAGRILRKARVWTAIGNDQHAFSKCASACSLMFIAGVNRLFAGDWLDLHRPSLPSSELAGMTLPQIETSNRELKQLLLGYANEMGVDRRFIEMSYSVPIDASKAFTVYDARDLHAAGMVDSEYDFRKGQLVRDIKLGTNADAIFAYYLGREHVTRDCMEQVYREAMGDGADPIDASLSASSARPECEARGFKAYPNQNGLKVPVEAHIALLTFAEKS